MHTISSIKSFSINPRVTTQEMHLKHILTREGIPFTFQKQFRFPDRWYIVDFFIADQLILECSQTRAFKYEVALRHKAIYLEAKCVHLKRFYDYPIWILFESYRPIGELLYQTLERLMPSVDQIITSSDELLEFLREYFSKNKISNDQRFSSSLPFSSHHTLQPTFGNLRQFTPHNLSTQNYCPYIWHKNNDYRQLIQQPQVPPFTMKNCLFNNYSHNLKKKFIERSEVFKI